MPMFILRHLLTECADRSRASRESRNRQGGFVATLLGRNIVTQACAPLPGASELGLHCDSSDMGGPNLAEKEYPASLVLKADHIFLRT